MLGFSDSIISSPLERRRLSIVNIEWKQELKEQKKQIKFSNLLWNLVVLGNSKNDRIFLL